MSGSKEYWQSTVPSGFVSLAEAARICGRHAATVRDHAQQLEVLRSRGNGLTALVKIEDVALLQESLKGSPVHLRSKKAPKPQAAPPPEPVVLVEPVKAPIGFKNLQAEFETTCRKLIHLCLELKIDSLTIQDGKAEVVRSVTVTREETIKG